MTPTNLPVQPATAATPGTPATPGTVATAETQTTDFLMMLGQLVAASVQRSGATLVPTGKVPAMVLDGAEKKDDLDPADVVALFSMGLPQPQPVTNIDVPVDGAIEQALQGFPGVGVGSDALTGSLQGILQEAAKQATEGKLVTDVAQNLDAPQTPDSLQGPTAPFQLQPQQMQAAQASHAHGATTHTVHSPVGSAAWADEVGTRVVMMTESGNHTASLKLSPEHLGPLEINITVRDDKASVWFGAAHADTRAAIETALPRLREMFESQGLSLADAGVFREPPREQAAVKNNEMVAGQGDAAEEVTSVSARARLGLVDAYA